MPVLSVSTLIPVRFARHCAVVVSAAAAVAFVTSGVQVANDRTTEQLEYAWFRDRLSDLPAGCAVAHVWYAGRRVVRLPSYVIGGAADEYDNALTAEQMKNAFGMDKCIYYAKTSICSTEDGRRPCDEVERVTVMERVASIVLPAVPSYDLLPYDGPSVELALFRVERPD